MSQNNFGGIINTEKIDINPIEYIPFSTKKKGDFQEYSEAAVRYIDSLFNPEIELDLRARYYVNYGLINARDISRDEDFIRLLGAERLKKFSVTRGNENLNYVPIVDQAVKYIYGQQIRRPFNPSVIDKSDISVSEYTEMRLNSLRNFFSETFLIPMQQQALTEWMETNKIEDFYSLEPQQQQEAQIQIEERVQSMTPPEIEKYMKHQWKSGGEKELAILMDMLSETFLVKSLSDNNIINLIATGKDLYYNGIRNKKVVYEIVNPIGFQYIGPEGDMFISNASIIKRERNVSFIDVLVNHGSNIGTKEYKIFKEISNLSSNSAEENRLLQQLRSSEQSIDPSRNIIDGYTLPNQKGAVMEIVDPAIRKEIQTSNFDVDFNKYTTEYHYLWKSTRKMKEVYRQTDKGVTLYHVDESYVMNPRNGDISVSTVYAPELFQCFVLGVGEKRLFLSKGLVPFQYPVLGNPFVIKQPYSGIDYNITMGNAKFTCPIEFAKPYIAKSLLVNKQLDEIERRNKGKVVAFLSGGDNDLEKLMDDANKFGAMKLDNTGLETEEGKRAMIRDIIDVLDLNMNVDEQAKMQKLEFYKNLMIQAIGANPYLINQSDRYVGKGVRENSEMHASYLSEGLFNIHNTALESSLQNLLENAIANIPNEEEMEIMVYSGEARMLRRIKGAVLKKLLPKVFIKSTSEDIMNLETSKQILMRYVEAAQIEYIYSLKIIWAQTKAELLEIAEEAHIFAMQNIENTRKHQENLVKMQQEAEDKRLQSKSGVELMKAEKAIERTIKYAEIMSSQLERQFDINRDGENDMMDMKSLEVTQRERKDLRTHEEKMRELDLKEKELELKYNNIQQKLKEK